MADIVDMANKETAAFTNQALSDCRRNRHQAKRAHRKCANCGEVIPPARRKAVRGVKFCVNCQKEIERAGY